MGCWEILENTGEPAISAKNRAVLSRNGFSLIEILMVVAIIAVLAGIAI
ncbi:MAG: prepilin-type N-terminal cleavage/methylation domain-containing protein, partial [Deltaproteobacteria bacterium]|nr:prepilin-type N-terminal cleavage/methylation domain-containing protein [Deltaproteobacteria bacterium]